MACSKSVEELKNMSSVSPVHPAALSLEFVIFCQINTPNPSYFLKLLLIILKSLNKVCKNIKE